MLFVHGLPFTVAPNEVVEVVADVTLACDRERGIAWGNIRDIKLVARHGVE
jgi:hypothetical protein